MISKITYGINVTRNLTDLGEYSSDYTYLTGTGLDPTRIQGNLARIIFRFPTNVREVYGPSVELDISDCFIGLLAGLFQVVNLIENDIDTQGLTNKIKTNVINKFAQYMENLNSDWKDEIVATVFTNIWSSWIEQAIAKKNKNEVAFAAADSKCMENIRAFIDVYLNGVYKQYSPVFF